MISSFPYDFTPSTICTLAGAALTLWYIASSLTAWYRLRHFPGPRLASFSYIWHFLAIMSDNTFDKYLALRDLGPLVRTGPNYLVTDDPEVLRKTMAARGTYTRDGWYRGARFAPHLENMASHVDTEAHDVLKAKTASSYSGREMGADLERAVDSQLVRLLDLIRRKYISESSANGKGTILPVNFSQVTRLFSLDVVSLLCFGEAWGHLDEGVDVLGWIGAMDTALPMLTLAVEIPLFRTLLLSRYGFLGFFGPKPTDKHGLGVVIGHINEIIRKRFEDVTGKTRHKDMLGGFMRNGMTRTEIEGEATLAMLAGNDTSAAVIRSTMLQLMLAPHAYAKFKREIKQAVDKGEVSSPITNEQSLKLPYTQAIVWEGLRISIPVTFGHYKIVPPEGETFHGKFVPPGTRIGHNSIALTRNKRVFGEDADIFRPERFIECSPEKQQEMMRAVDITFGGGRWTCSGKSIAFMELNKFYFELMRAFDFQPVNPLKPGIERVFVSRFIDEMWVSITEADWDYV